MNQFIGVIPAKVMTEPDDMGRVQVELEHTNVSNLTARAPIATMMSGGGRGSWVMPEIGDDCLVAFKDGNPDEPYVIGFMWNGVDKGPTADQKERHWQSVNGHRIIMYDPDISSGDKGYLRIEDGHGNFIQLSNAQITIQSMAVINIQAPTVLINGRPVVVSPSPI